MVDGLMMNYTPRPDEKLGVAKPFKVCYNGKRELDIRLGPRDFVLLLFYLKLRKQEKSTRKPTSKSSIKCVK